ncbi:ATP-binding protein [Wenjunlia tyrosinilytica]|nr:ATP-binding protein [Wenjunlia tyrosinilytica]
MTVRFPISLRRDHDDIPEQDARRVRAMRHLAKARMRYCGLAALADDVELVVSELVTNAIEHSRGTQITMTLRLLGSILRITVRDGTARRPRIRRPDDDAENGRGLLLVRWIAEQHHGFCGTSPDGTTAWCALPARRR